MVQEQSVMNEAVTDHPPLTEEEIEELTISHSEVKDGCNGCFESPWPCRTARLLAEREHAKAQFEKFSTDMAASFLNEIAKLRAEAAAHIATTERLHHALGDAEAYRAKLRAVVEAARMAEEYSAEWVEAHVYDDHLVTIDHKDEMDLATLVGALRDALAALDG